MSTEVGKGYDAKRLPLLIIFWPKN